MASPPIDLDERVAVLTRFREALVRQRARFRRYLDSLETVPEETDDPNSNLEFHIDLERTVIREISNLERIFEPLEAIYRETDPAAAEVLPELKLALDRTRTQVLKLTEVNQQIFRQELDELQRTVAALRAPDARNRRLRIAGVSQERPVLVDLTA